MAAMREPPTVATVAPSIGTFIPDPADLQNRLSDENRQRWIFIQLNTFTNWLNQQLVRVGRHIEDLSAELADGVLLIQLVEALQHRTCTGKIYRQNPTEIQMLMNVQMALDALREDGVKLVNIGSHDIVEGNLKLILGLIWCLIQRYQISARAKIPPKKLMMAWIQSALPELKITNFRSNWNDGRALSALLDYCQPGLCPEWRHISANSNPEANCARALELAEKYLQIPTIISAEHLCSPDLDELSCITYLSYYTKRTGPGYKATLQRVQQLLPEVEINNFENAWNDGFLLCHLVEAVGGEVVDIDRLRYDNNAMCIENIRKGLNAAQALGVSSLISADDINDPDVEHLGIMALAAALTCCAGDITTSRDVGTGTQQTVVTTCYQQQQVNLDLAFADGSEVRVDELHAVIIGPNGGQKLDPESVQLRKSRTLIGAVVSLIPTIPGYHQVHLHCQGIELPSSPISLQVLATPSTATSKTPPPLIAPPAVPPNSHPQQLETMDYNRAPPSEASSQVSFSGLSEPCSIGSIVEVVINAHGDSQAGVVLVEAVAPSGHIHKCHVLQKSNSYTATFTPNEVGDWHIGILYQQEHIRGSPFSCFVYDANLVQVYGLDVGLVGQELKFSVDTQYAGQGTLKVSVLRHGRSIQSSVIPHMKQAGLYQVRFTLDGAGQYSIHVLFNSSEVKGSPFILDIADASSVSIYGDNLRMASVDRLSTFTIHAATADAKDINVIITAPSGKRKRARIFPLDEGAYRVEWKPVEAGEHSLDVRLYNQSVHESPFVCNVGDPELVSVRNMPQYIETNDMLKDHTFEIDASAAGSGNLEIMINGGRVPCRVRELGGRRYLATFAPTTPTNHLVEMRFNGDPVRSSPWRIVLNDNRATPEQSQRTTPASRQGRPISSPPAVDIVEREPAFIMASELRREPSYAELTGLGLQKAPVGKRASFFVSGAGIRPEHIVAKLEGPNGEEIQVRVYPEKDGCRCEYIVKEIGEHRLDVRIGGQRVQGGAPLIVSAYAAERVRVQPVAGGAPLAPVQLLVDAQDAGKGQLEISVNQGRVPNNVQMQGAGRCLVTFIPQHAGTYVIDVTFNGEQVQGCPIRVEILPKQIGQKVATEFAQGGLISQETAIIRTSPTPLSQQAHHHTGLHSPQQQSQYHYSASHHESASSHSPRSAIIRDARSPAGVLSSPIREVRSSAESYFSDSRSPLPATQAPASPPMVSHVRSSSREGQLPQQTSEIQIPRSPSLLRQAEHRSMQPSREMMASRWESTNRPGSDVAAGTPSPRPFGDRQTPEITHSPRADYFKSTSRPWSREEEHRYKPWDTNRSPDQKSDRPWGDTVGYTVAQYGHDQPTTVASYGVDRRHTPPGDTEGKNDVAMIRTTYERYAEKPIEDKPLAGGDSVSGYSSYSGSSYRPPTATEQQHETARKRSPSPKSRQSPPLKHRSPSPKHFKKRSPSPKLHSHSPTLIRRSVSPFRKADSAEILDNSRSNPLELEFTRTQSTVEDLRRNFEDPRHRYETTHLLKDAQKPPAQREPAPDYHDDYRKPLVVDVPPPLPTSPPPPDAELHRYKDMEKTELDVGAMRTAEYMKVKEEDDRKLAKMGINLEKESPRPYAEQMVDEPIAGKISPRIAAKREEFALNRADEVTDSKIEQHITESASPSTTPKTTPKTTPRLSLKFRKDKDAAAVPGEDKLFDWGKSKFTSKHEVVKRGKEVEVKLEPLKLAKDETLKVVVIPPVRPGEPLRPETEPKVKKSGKTYEISFKPTEVGTHKVIASVGAQSHPNSPFPIRVYDAAEIVVGEIPKLGKINEPIEFSVDAGHAGFGNLEMAIKDHDGVIIPSHVTQMEGASAKFLVTFTPTKTGMHTVNITFNKEGLKNSPFEIEMIEEVPPAGMQPPMQTKLSKKESTKLEKEERKREKEEKLRREKEEKAMQASLKKKDSKKKKVIVTKAPTLQRNGEIAELLMTVPGKDQIDVQVLDANKEVVRHSLHSMENDQYRIEFTPRTVGDHEIDVKYADVEINGSPFTCRVYDPNKISVGTIPMGIVDKPVHFVVDASAAGVGNLEVAVNDGKIPSMAHALGQHRYDISFVPREEVEHYISVKFNNEAVPGSPFLCRMNSSGTTVTASGGGLERVSVGRPTQFQISIDGFESEPPNVRITDAHGAEVLSTVRLLQPNLFSVEYIPQTIDIEHEGEPISGSPLTAKAYDAGCARMSTVDHAQVGQPCTFMIDAAKAGAGNMEIIVSVDQKNVPNFVQAEGQARFKVSFTPQEAKDHLVSVRFNGEPIPGSPMTVSVNGQPITQSLMGAVPGGVGEIRLVGDVSYAQAGQPKKFSLDTGGKAGDCNVIITAPDGTVMPIEIERVNNGFHVECVPNGVGKYQIDLIIDGRKVGRKPLIMNVVDETLVRVSRIPSIAVAGRKYAFEVDASRAGEGEIRVEAKTEDGRLLDVHVEPTDEKSVGRVSCRFTELGKHAITVLFNDRPIGQPIMVKVVDAAECARVQRAPGILQVEQMSRLEITVEKGIGKHLSVQAIGPDNNPLPVALQRISDGTFEAEWLPRAAGEHRLGVLVADHHIRGSPYTVSVVDLSAVRVIGLKPDRVGQEQKFNVDWSSSGGKEIAVRVTRDGAEVDSQLKKLKNGLHVCSFVPKDAGQHLVDVYVDGNALPECPYECFVNDMGSVRARGDALIRAQRGKTARFEVSMANAGRGELDVLISDQSGGPLPVRCYRQQDDSYWVEFTPQEIGTHTIDVTFADVPVAGSPFRCEVVDPRKISVKGTGEPLTLRQQAQLTVVRALAGKGDLTVEVTDPSGTPVQTQVLKSPSGDHHITFLPTKLGQHKVALKVAGFQVPGSPHILLVEEAGRPTAHGAAIDHAVEVGTAASIFFDPKVAKGSLKVDVKGALIPIPLTYCSGPRNKKVKHTTNKRPDGTSEIAFTPDEIGTYTANIHYNDKPITGSPFEIAVVDPRKVIINDELLDRNGHLVLSSARQNVIDVDATAAGPGKLRAEMRDADGKLVPGAEVESLGYGKYRLLLWYSTPGKYNVYLYWAEMAVNSAFPLQAIAQPDNSMASTSKATIAQPLHAREKSDDELSDHLRVVLRGEGLTRAITKEPAELIVDGSDCRSDGRVTCTLTGHKADIPVRLTNLGNRVHKAVYTPLVGGQYELQIQWDGKHVRGSPFRVQVDAVGSPAELISVDTNTLRIGIINEDIKTVIDTRRAGPGQLSAQCMGPSKLAYCELYDHRDGTHYLSNRLPGLGKGTYTLSVRPSEVGMHTLVVKYQDEHVPGSPFQINVSHPPDPSKVRVSGPGVEHGILSSYKSNFVVETKGAGAGQLTVRVRGPKGAFNVEMQRERKQERTIQCKYEPREPGDYVVDVKWHGENVPGSPFLVMIVDTEQELERFLRGEAPSPQPATPFVPPGWLGPPPPPGAIFGPPPPGARLPPGAGPMSMMAPGGPYGHPGPMPPPPGAMPPHHRMHRQRYTANGY